jgi:hypothetical protein
MFAGAAATLGIPPHRLLRADPVELALTNEIARHAARYAADRDAALANRIIAELAHAMKRGNR